ncbi:ribosome quality control complex subunit NEMF homolog [Macrosteles quadrilineatus]|uniref:ribosome quality control complex subunit NEMF homolog n=1 Tax=Macrosteles quadrilineatus TaxID=74068 RepID=UPI0023E0BD91|nr:ribosome quality control complex subunit NEMF homolog [Macrosteles quadrilineatus]
MKSKFSTYDIVCLITELQRLVGMRVQQVYDIDHKTYLIKLQRTEEKAMLLIESGCRIHTTAFEWPKNMAPSGFSMKMRKHLRNKRLEVLKQMGMDRIIDLQFGSGEAAYHVILELYDRGNIVLTDYELTILNVLRPHTEGDKIRFAVREKYPTDRVHQRVPPPTIEQLKEIFSKAKNGESLKKILNPHLEYGPAVIDHMLLKVGLPPGVKLGKGFDLSQLHKICEALQEAEALLDQALQQPSKGYVVQKAEKRLNKDGESDELITNQEFHPHLFMQVSTQLYKEFDSFDLAVDEFFSQMEAQKIDVKALQQEKEALKKLENVRKDHQDRLHALQQNQEVDKQKAELILRNQELVESCLLVVRTALANQLPWPAIDQLISEARSRSDPVAQAITKLKLETNHISLSLSDPFSSEDSDSNDSSEDEEKIRKIPPMTIDIDLAQTSFANAKKYYDKKRSAAKKQQKTVESAGKALKSAEKKTKQTLKEVQAMTTITKARKVFWFEKFFWFISSENYLVIGGRDQIQNELIVKRYLRGSDVYVHADLHGASSVVVKNPSPSPVPPKTLNEAGVMAICYSAAWDAKVTTSAWWVHADQVSKTAPTGEYLTTGSFMIRGKKNYLPPCHLIMGFAFMFKLEESSIERHKDERRVRTVEDDNILEETVNNSEDVEVELSDDEPGEKDGSLLEDVKEEEEDNDDDEEPHFPDTQIRVDHTSENKVSVTAAMGSLDLTPKAESEQTVVYLGDDQPVVITPAASRQKQQKPQKQSKDTKQEEKEEKEEKEKQNTSQVKRGQKGKLKKIKEKYKDQDEEERKLRMLILQSAGSGKVKETKKTKKNAPKPPPVVKKPVPKPSTKPTSTVGDKDGAGDSGGEEEEGETVTADVDMLVSLTGQPVADDELLFAVPVVAPYNTVINYKYKVKLTPGTGKRGKAAKTALNMFLKDRSATNHERDLMRSVKDQNMARNLPGKVKVSAPQLQKLKK